MRTAVVLAAGGLTGQAFHLGALSALERELGFDARDADALVGTSAGSLVAAGLAAGLSAGDMAAELLGEPMSAQGRAVRTARRGAEVTAESAPGRSDRRPLAPGALLAAARQPWRVRPGALASGLLPAGRESTAPISRGIAQLLGGSWPERDLRICAVRARDSRRVVFGTPGAPSVDVGTAVAASCAIPAYFRPVQVDGELHVDGGVHSPSNADVVLRDRPDLVVVSSPMSLGPGGARRPRVDTAVRVAVRRYLAAEVRRLRRAGCTVVVLQPSPADLEVMGANPMRAGGQDDVVRSARATVGARLLARPELAGLLAQR